MATILLDFAKDVEDCKLLLRKDEEEKKRLLNSRRMVRNHSVGSLPDQGAGKEGRGRKMSMFHIGKQKTVIEENAVMEDDTASTLEGVLQASFKERQKKISAALFKPGAGGLHFRRTASHPHQLQE